MKDRLFLTPNTGQETKTAGQKPCGGGARMETILELKNIVKTYPGVKALDNISLSFQKERCTPLWAKTEPENPL